jgi:hypothetical protein
MMPSPCHHQEPDTGTREATPSRPPPPVPRAPTPGRVGNTVLHHRNWIRVCEPSIPPTSKRTPGVAVTDPKISTPAPPGAEGPIARPTNQTSQSTPPESAAQVAAKLRARRQERNNERLRTVDADDRKVLEGESLAPRLSQPHIRPGNPANQTYLNVDPKLFFPPPRKGPDDRYTPPGWFLTALTKLGNTREHPPNKSPIQFASTEEAARANAETLKSVNYDLAKLIGKFPNTTLGYGSEFRPTGQLRLLLGKHPNFNALADVIDNGMSYVFTRTLSPSEQRHEMLAILDRGNHKSAQDLPEHVSRLLDKDVVHGFAIPLPISTILQIPNAGVQPLGLASQWSIDASGQRTAKYRLTQDLSFSSSKTGPNLSVNKRVDMTAYPEMVYGWCLTRILHFVVALRLQFPWRAILVAKYDYSDAYRRIAHSAQAATQTIAVQKPLAYMSLRLTFGGSPNPPTWCMFSEMVTDLANEISACLAWNPRTLRSPAQPRTPEPIRVDAAVPIAPAREMTVIVPTGHDLDARVDGFIDDLINVFLDTPQNCCRQPHVVPLAMHVTSRPHAGDDQEPLPRRPILSTPKLIAEGGPAEEQTVLGWNLDTRRLRLALPLDKFLAWREDIEKVLMAGTCPFADLEQLVGRLNHASYVLPTARHFLSRLRSRIEPKYRKAKRVLKLSEDELSDLSLWIDILSTARSGISLNLLVTRQPDRICWSDACPFGIGGYGLDGHAWRIVVPEGSILRGHRSVNNLLEFLGMAVNIWLECTRQGKQQHACILAVGDNTSALGWLHRTSQLDPNGPAHRAHLLVARHIATLLMKYECCLGSQHVKGELNVIADLLSFEGSVRGKRHPLAFDNPPNDVLTSRFHNSPFATQVPPNFAIHQLPDEMLCWVSRVLQTAASSLTAARKGETKHMTGSGDGGWDSASTQDMQVTPSSLCYQSSSATWSPSPSYSAIGLPDGPQPGALQESVRSRWESALSAKPQATWLRRFGAISGSAPCTSKAEQTCVRSPEA